MSVAVITPGYALALRKRDECCDMSEAKAFCIFRWPDEFASNAPGHKPLVWTAARSPARDADHHSMYRSVEGDTKWDCARVDDLRTDAALGLYNRHLSPRSIRIKGWWGLIAPGATDLQTQVHDEEHKVGNGARHRRTSRDLAIRVCAPGSERTDCGGNRSLPRPQSGSCQEQIPPRPIFAV
jgi:hypothetical protein